MTLLGVSLVADAWGIAISGTYLLALLGIGWFGRRAIRSQSMSEFFLAGRSFGPFVLLLTLFATQYSGNTLIGVPGKTFRIGYAFLVAVPMFVAIITVAMVLAPGLQRLGQRHNCITLADVVHHRFQSRTLTTLVSLICMWALINFLISNLVAVGYLVEIATESRVSREAAIVGLAAVMVIYETLGGLRAVAWTDVVQGSLILVGITLISVAVLITYGGPATLHNQLSETAPQLLTPPDWMSKIGWASTLILVGVGAAIYPQAVQRYFSAKSGDVLCKSLRWMLPVPFVIATFSVLIGISGRALFPNLDAKESEQITMLVLRDLIQHSPWLWPIVVLFLTAVLASIMSTVDSVLLALAATVTKDLYLPIRGVSISEKHLTRSGKLISWALMACAVVVAMTVSESVWRLVEIKLEIMIQAAPAVIFALYGRSIRPLPIIIGLLVGLAFALAPLTSQLLMPVFGSQWNLPAKWNGLHLGVLGFLMNVVAVWASSRLLHCKSH